MTEKESEEIFKGIHFIRVGNLPTEQQEFFKEWLPGDQLIKIMIEKKIFPDCVQYHHYNHWYDHVYPTQEDAKRKVSKPAESKNQLFGFSFLKSADPG